MKLFTNDPVNSKIVKTNVVALITGLIAIALNLLGDYDPDLLNKINQVLVLIAPVLTLVFRIYFTNPNYPIWLEELIIQTGEANNKAKARAALRDAADKQYEDYEKQ